MGNKKFTENLEPDKIYHVFNRGINGAKIFNSNANYHFFLLKLQEHITPIADLYCYCLLPNHFHLLLKIKSEEEIYKLLNNKDKTAKQIVFQKFSNFFNSYAQAYNKGQGRSGKLFDLPFKRKNIENEEYLRQTVLYIHNNPKKHGIINNVSQFLFSSFKEIVSDRPTFLKRNEVICWFENKENFIFSNLNQP